MTDSRKRRQFHVRYDLDYDLDNKKDFTYQSILIIQIVVNLKKKVLDLHKFFVFIMTLLSKS